MRHIFILLCLIAASVPLPAWSNDDRLWVVWERALTRSFCADPEACPEADYYMHVIEGIAPLAAQGFYRDLAPAAEAQGRPNLHLRESPFCAPKPDAPLLPPERIIADKIETLRGIEAIYVDARGIRGPAEFEGGFGQIAQDFINATFARHGIRVLDRDEQMTTPGAPFLQLRYTREVFGCKPWSISLSLRQDVVLARDQDVMIEATTWSTWVQANETEPDFDVRQGMEQAVLNFSQAWAEANDPDWTGPDDS